MFVWGSIKVLDESGNDGVGIAQKKVMNMQYEDDYWTDVVTLKEGMKVKDLPEDWRGSFGQPIAGGRPEFKFQSGTFYKLTYIEWDVFEAPIPWGTTIILCRRTWNYRIVPPKMSMSGSSQLKMAEIAMSPKGYGETGIAAQRHARGIVWC